MNKRLERVETAKKGLEVIHDKMHDAVFNGSEIIVTLENGYVFYIQGFTTRDSFDKAKKEAEETLAAKSEPI